MARLFSITIPFGNQQYTALVSLREQGHDLCCIVRYIDKLLRNILQGNQLIFSLQEGLKQPKHLHDPIAESLVICTTNAITHHLTAKVFPINKSATALKILRSDI